MCYTYDMDRRVRISSMQGVGESVCYTYDMDRRVRIRGMEGVTPPHEHTHYSFERRYLITSK